MKISKYSTAKTLVYKFTLFAWLMLSGAALQALEVKGITTDLNYKLKAPLGCGEIKSWHGEYTDLDGRTRHDAHRGLDIVAEKGTPIIAAASGRVIYKDKQHAGGNALMIYHGSDMHGNHVISYYAHLLDFSAEKEATVKRGEIIGTLGDSGSNMPASKTPHLHFEVLLYPDDDMKYWFTGFLRGFTTTSPNYFIYPIEADKKYLNGYVFPEFSSIKKSDSSAAFNGFSYPLYCKKL